MPSIIVGPVIFNTNEGQIITGDTFYVAPKSTSKVVAGSGAFNTGPGIVTNNGINSTNGLDPDVVDSNIDEAL